MEAKIEIEKLKAMSLKERSEQKPIVTPNFFILLNIAFFILGIIYGLNSPEQEYAGYNHVTYESVYKYPDNSIYNTIGPWFGFFLIAGVGMLAVYIASSLYMNKWSEYNKIIQDSKDELIRIAKEERKEKQRQKEESFSTALNNMISKYGEPDAKFCLSDEFDMSSYIIPFSSVQKILLLGAEMDFKDIIDVQLTDDQKIIKGQITAVTKSDNGSVIGRAIVGGVIGGDAGAVIGGSSATKNTTYTQAEDKILHNYTIMVTTKNISNPLININVNRDVSLANNIVATLKAVIANQ